MDAKETASDKYYWHRFLPLYEKHLGQLSSPNNIFEYGVFKGDSIRWLMEKYPKSKIYGADIISPLPSWPVSKNVTYLQLDQGDQTAIRHELAELNCDFDLVIEDGSHHPLHQKNCLVETTPYIGRGGVYILEDIHTSQTELRNSGLIAPVVKDWFKKTTLIDRILNKFGSVFSVFNKVSVKSKPLVNCLTLSLAIERARTLGRKLTPLEIQQLTSTNFFATKEVEYLDSRISEIEIFRRSTLPLSCNTCQSEVFNLAQLQCLCGRRLYCDDDSMTVVMHLN